MGTTIVKLKCEHKNCDSTVDQDHLAVYLGNSIKDFKKYAVVKVFCIACRNREVRIRKSCELISLKRIEMIPIDEWHRMISDV